MTTDAIDPQEMALAELAKAMCPTPDDLAEMVSPLALTYFCERLLYTLLTVLVAQFTTDEGVEPDPTSTGAKVLQAVMSAAGNMDAACVELGLLPPEAVPS